MPRFYLKNRTVLQKAMAAVRGKLVEETPQYRAMISQPPPPMPLRRAREPKAAAAAEPSFDADRMLRNFYGSNPLANTEIVQSFNTKTSTVGSRFVERQVELMREGWTEEAAFEAVDELFNSELEKLELDAALRET